MNLITKDQYEDFLNQKYQLINRLLPLNKTNKWNFDGELDGIKIHLLRDDGFGLNYIRTEGIIKASVEKIIEFVSKRELIPKWDPTVEYVTLLDDHDDYSLEYYIMAQPDPEIPKRDFICMTSFKEEPDGSILIYGGSYHLETHEKVEGMVRAEVPILGWKLFPDKDDCHLTHFVYLDLIDFREDIPKEFVDGESSEQAKAIKTLRDVLEGKLIIE